jgi:hypothetical protein
VCADVVFTCHAFDCLPQVDMDAVQSLASLKRMRRLDLSGLKVTDDVLEALLQGNGATLTCLSLASCDQLTDKVGTHISNRVMECSTATSMSPNHGRILPCLSCTASG